MNIETLFIFGIISFFCIFISFLLIINYIENNYTSYKTPTEYRHLKNKEKWKYSEQKCKLCKIKIIYTYNPYLEYVNYICNSCKEYMQNDY